MPDGEKINDSKRMEAALNAAREAALRSEVPVGAALFDADGTLIAADGNRILELKDPTAHAEMLVLRAGAKKLDNERLLGAELYVTLEPCAMCAGAISLARVARLVYAAEDPKGGAIAHGAKFFTQPTCHHRPAVERMEAEEAGALLKAFFKARRGPRSKEEASP